ncbi:MAG4270 family putative restriction endonuclease [Mycoplasma sp. VS292A]|uniref:MAG4270 family putative restriction endonuclease n=1 Tax=Mycoplasma sp. VS292A TaxID=3401680 RepID=UPI003AAE8584
MSKIEIFKIPMCTKSYYSKTSQSAKGQFDLYVAFDTERLIIYDIFVNFLNLEIDLCNTKSHFNSNLSNFKIRKHIFSQLGLELIPRQSTKENKLLKLNAQQLIKFSSLVNTYYFQENQKNIKELIYLLKGNNPGGSVTRKENSELILDEKRNSNGRIFYNLPLIIDAITIGINFSGDSLHHMLAHYQISEHEIKNFDTMIEIIKNNDSKYLWSGICMLEITGINLKEQNDTWIKNMSTYIKNLSNSNKLCKSIKETIKKYRSTYAKRVEGKKIFDIEYSTEKAHIYNVEWIQKEAFDYCANDPNRIDDQRYHKIINQISDENNYLNLEPNIHKSFDRYEFSYNENGRLIQTKQALKDNVRENTLHSYYQIPKDKLNKQIKDYIKKRNNYIENNNLLDNYTKN